MTCPSSNPKTFAYLFGEVKPRGGFVAVLLVQFRPFPPRLSPHPPLETSLGVHSVPRGLVSRPIPNRCPIAPLESMRGFRGCLSETLTESQRRNPIMSMLDRFLSRDVTDRFVEMLVGREVSRPEITHQEFRKCRFV